MYRSMEEISLKRAASDLLKVFEPIAISLDCLQSDNCVLGDVFEVWMDLRCQFPDEYFTRIARRSEFGAFLRFRHDDCASA